MDIPKSLNAIAHFIAGRVNSATDYYTIEEIKFAVSYYRAVLLRREIERQGADNALEQSFVVELAQMQPSDCTFTLPNACLLFKTVKKVPFPVRNKTGHFGYVGRVDYQKSFTLIQPEELQFLAYSKFTGRTIKFFYHQNHIYVVGSKWLKRLLVRGVFENPSEVADLCVNSTTCFSDDEPYPIGLDMLETIVTNLLSKEFSIRGANLEVKIDK